MIENFTYLMTNPTAEARLPTQTPVPPPDGLRQQPLPAGGWDPGWWIADHHPVMLDKGKLAP